MKAREKIRRAKLATRGFTDDEVRQLCSRHGAGLNVTLRLHYGDYADARRMTIAPVRYTGRIWDLIPKRASRE